MNRLNKSVHINPTFAWTDWELYEDAKATNTARLLNELLRDLVNAGCDRDEVERQMLATMESDAFSEVGANDTEPRRFLDRILEEIYG